MSINKLATVQRNDNYTVEYWSKYLLGMIKLEQTNFVFTKLGKTVEIPKNSGTKTWSVRRYNSLPVSEGLTNEQLEEGKAPTPLKIEAQKVQGTINQYGAYIEETDWVNDIHDDDIKQIYMPELSRHAAEVIERNIINAFSEASEYIVNEKEDVDSLESTDILTMKDIRKVSLTMKNYRRHGHSKFGGHPVLVVHANVMQDLLDDEDLRDRMLDPGNDNTPIKAGTLQKYKVYGFYIIETLIGEVKANEATEPINVYTSYLLGKDPYVSIKLGGSNISWETVGFKASHAQPLGQVASFGYKLWTGAKIVDPIAITKIYSASGFDVFPDFSNDNLGATASQL